MTVQKVQPWKAAWPPVEREDNAGIEYGVMKGDVAVVDGTAANVKPKTQPWKATGPPASENTEAGIEYGVARGDVAIVDGASRDIKPAKKQD